MINKIKVPLTILLAGFLVTYHSVKLYGHFVSEQSMDAIAVVFRVMVVLSLLLLAFNRRWGLGAMWLSIGGFVIYQMATAYDASLMSLVPPLKGFIIPTAITWLLTRK